MADKVNFFKDTKEHFKGYGKPSIFLFTLGTAALVIGMALFIAGCASLGTIPALIGAALLLAGLALDLLVMWKNHNDQHPTKSVLSGLSSFSLTSFLPEQF